MADPRARVAVKIVDPTTGANEAGVTAAGEVKVLVNAALPAGANSIGIVDTELTTQDYDSGAGTATTAVTGVVVAASGGPVAIPGDAANGLDVDVTRVSGTVTITGALTDTQLRASSVPVDTELPAAAALADAVGNPTVPTVGSALLGYNGSTFDRVRTANTGRLQVDVVTGGGAASPTSPQRNRATSASLAAGSSVDLDGTQITSAKTGKLAKVRASSSVPIKVDIKTVLNGTATLVDTFFVAANSVGEFTPPHENYVQQAESATAGIDAFRATITNNDNNTAGDVYASFYWQEV